ncbi:hypothetical protein [uncultured Microbacterium sp.]|uniref:hypothetical protein n=1 Tax=uncultured Microbacterium sp. TaxID=191216 RepID=UPI0025991462|nr:hypothetical protein [uncultured Microbacterium sp.]
MSIATPQARSYASYGAQFSGCYDVIFPRDMVTDAETSWLRTVLPARGRRVVELGVGNGRVALPLAAAFAADRTPVEYVEEIFVSRKEDLRDEQVAARPD